MTPAAEAVEREPSSIVRRPSERISRAERRGHVEASVSKVKFPWGLEARLLNISSSGVLFESGTRVPPDNCQRLTLSGPDIEIEVPAHFVRSEVALVNGLGVKYHIAVTFPTPLELDGARRPPVAPVQARTLGHLLAHLGTELGQHPHGDRRIAVERAVRRVLGARDVRIHEGSSAPADSGDALAFTVPLGADAPAVLRIGFAPGVTPTESDLRLSRAAAQMAAVVLAFDGPL